MRHMLLFCAATCLAQQPSLTQFLNLTPAQVTAMQQLNTAYYSYLSTENNRVGTVDFELYSLYDSPPPDPNQLGPRYVELEAIRRDIAAHSTALQQQLAPQLTAAQRTAIQTLNTAVTLQPLISAGQCAFLLDAAAPNVWFNSAQFAISGDFSVLVGSYIPYLPAPPTASFCGSNVFPIAVREYLGLSDGQVSAIFNASAAYSDYYARQQNAIADLQVQIRDETTKPSPDPSVLGMKYVQLAAIGQDLRDRDTQLRQSARATLTPAQMTQLSILQTAVTLAPLITAAESCNLLVPTPGQGTNYYANYCSLQ